MHSRYDPDRHHRRSIRLPGYDYRQAGVYFVTLCTLNRECLFGEIVQGEMRLNEAGRLAQACWQEVVCHFANVALDLYVVMPNHLHGILLLNGAQAAGSSERMRMSVPQGTTAGSLSAILQNYKSVTTRLINRWRGVQGAPLWQRNFYERVLRDVEEWDRARQ